MSFPAKCVACSLVLLLAGCVATGNRNPGRVADWEDLDTPDQPVAPTAITLSSTATNPPPTTHTSPTPDPVESGMHPRETWVALAEWSRSRALAPPARLSLGPSSAYAVQATNGVLVLTVGSVIARWDGLELHLGFAPQLINGQIYVHALDLLKTLQPLLQGPPASRLSPGSVVVIDPGHGGADIGTKSVLRNYYEKDLTLDWALRLRSLLIARGCQVYLTRSTDIEVARSNRVAFAAQRHADIFLSLHFNSAGEDSNEAGLETYCLTPTGMPSSITRGFADETWLAFPNNAFDGQNLRLALSVHRALLQVNGHLDRGVRRARFPTVLRGQQRPAILIEGGYLSNPHEARLICESAHREQLAEAVVRALIPKGEVAFRKGTDTNPEASASANGTHSQSINNSPANSAASRDASSIGDAPSAE